QLTLDSVLDRAGRLFATVAIVSRQPDGNLHRYTYADFHRRARSLAEVLQQSGLRRGERVGTLMWNHHVHLEALFGVPAAGGVVHTLNHRLHGNDLSYIMNHAEDRFVIVDDLLLPLWEEVRERVDCERVIVVSHSGQPVARGYEDYEMLLRRAEGNFSYPSLHENEAAVMCYTTGTAGSPKGVVYSHRALVLHSLTISLPDALNISQHDTVMPLVPIYHANAWGLPFAATMAGSKQVFAGADLRTESVLDLAASEQVTLSAGVPITWSEVQDRLDRQPDRWKLAKDMRVMISGAAPPESMIRDLDRHGIRIIQAWGLVESGPLATISTVKASLDNAPEEKKYEIRATQGIPLPFVDVRAIGDSGPLAWDGTSLGEVQLRSPWVTASYYNLPELRGKWTEDGWFRTGDVVKIDPEGYVKLTDRAKDLIRYGDDWISSVDLENELMGHPAVKEAAVIAVQHPRWQERPLAAVTLKEGEHATAEELREFLAKKFAAWQLPDAIVFVSSLPHTPTGKLLKKELRKQFKNWKWEQKGELAI
ncbi:MAG TPA: long-chain fatty acid--CoA ligase, partial [Terriglobales bacterium]|nr:long-chain fatty acid--CoA ligase [Terriglobales bacterium]